MNSRIEGGKCTNGSEKPLDTKEQIIEMVNDWYESEEIESIEEITDTHIMYLTDESGDYGERYIVFPDADSVQRIKKSVIFDKEVESYIDVDKFADFLYNGIDVNALASLNKLVLTYDKDIDDDDYDYSPARYELENLTGDEYAFEVGEGNLGINWVDKSIVIVSISELVQTTKEIAEDDAMFYGGSWENFFQKDFREGFLQTVCHELRHLVYECNEFATVDYQTYPADGGLEENVEEYGNTEASNLLINKEAVSYINAMMRTPPEVLQAKELRKNERNIERG